jgi:hypothetical protein
VKLYEVYTDMLISEVGEGTSKPFPISSRSNIEIDLNRLANIAKKHPGDSNKPWTSDLSFFYDFENDKGVKYSVNFRGWAQVDDSYFSYDLRRALGGEKNIGPKEITFNSSYNVSFDILGGKEEETNFQEQYRVLATVVQCVRDFIEQTDKTPIPVMKLDIVPKTGEGEEKGMDNRRGKFYLAYIKKQVKTLPGDWSVIKMYGDGGVEIKRGKWTGRSVMDLNN